MEKRKSRLKRFFKISLICFCVFFTLSIFAYVFRVSLFSSLICTQIAKAIEENSGIKVKIEEFSGTYFFDIKIKKIQLIDGNGILSELDISEISAYYNPFALLSGEQIVQKIEIKKPKVTVLKIPQSKKTEKAPNNEDPFDIDLDFILGQVPEVNIEDVHFSYSIDKQKLKLESLTFKNKDLQSELSIKKIFAQNADSAQSISAFSLQMGIKKKVFSIRELKMHLDQYEQDIKWENLISLPIDNLEKLPLSFSVPTPGGIIDGTVALASGKYLQVKKGEIDFHKTLQLMSLLQGKEFGQKVPGKLAFNMQLSLPKWNPSSLKGTTQIDIYEKAPKKWNIQPQKNNDLRTYFYIENLAIIEKMIAAFIPLDPMKVSGKLAFSNALSLQENNIRVEGNISEGAVATKYFPEQVISGQWKANYNLEKTICDIPNIQFQLGDIKAHCKSYVDLSQEKKSFVDAGISIPSLKKYLDMFAPLKEMYDGSIYFKIKADGLLPNIEDIKKDADFRGELQCKLDNIVIQGQKLGNLSLSANFRVTKNYVHITKLNGFWNAKKIFQFSLKSGFSPGSPFYIKGRYRLKNLSEKLRQFIPDIDKIIQGSLDGNVKISGKIPDSDLLDILFENNVTLTDGTVLDSLPYKAISNSTKLRITNKKIDIQAFDLHWEKQKIAAIKGKLALDPKEKSLISSSLNILDPLSFLPQKTSQFTLEKMSIDTKIWGRFLQIEQGNPVYIKTDIALNKGSVQDPSFANSFDKIQCSLAAKLSKKQLYLRSLNFDLDKNIVFQILPSYISLQKNAIAKLHLKTSLKNISQYVKIPEYQIDSVEKDFSVDIQWKNLHLDNLEKFSEQSHLLQQKPQLILKHAQKNLLAKMHLLIKSAKGKVAGNPYTNTSFEIKNSWNKGICHLNKIEAWVNKKKFIDCTGKYNTKTQDISLNANAYLKKIQNLLPEPTLRGDVKTSIFLSGKLPQKNVPLNFNGHCKVSIANANILQKIQFNSMDFNTDFKTQEDILSFTSVFLTDHEKIWETKGNLSNSKNHLNAKIDSEVKIENVERYLIKFLEKDIFQGNFSLKNSIEAKWSYQNSKLDFVNVDLETACSQGKIQNYPYQLISFKKKASLQNQTVRIHSCSLSLDNEKLLNISGDIGLEKNATSDLNGEVLVNDIEKLAKRFFPQNQNKLEGRFSFKFFANGSLANISNGKLGCTLKLEKLAYQNKPLATVKWENKIQAQDKMFTVEKSLLSYGEAKLLELTGNFGYQPGNPFDLVLKSEIGDLINYFAPILLDKKTTIFNGKSHVYLKAKGKIPAKNDPLDLKMELKVPITTANEDYWEIVLDGASLWGNKKTEPHGLDSLIQISGTQANPIVKSIFNFKQDLIRLPEANTRVNDVLLEGVIGEQKLNVTLKCLIGGGSVSCTTKIAFDQSYFPQTVDIAVKGERVLLIRNDMLYGRTDLDVYIKGNISETKSGPKFKGKLGGLVDITEFKVTADMTVDALLQPSPERTSTKEIGISSPFLDLELGLRIKISQVAIYSSLARIKMKGNIQVRGSNERPEISGWIGTTSGTLFLPQGNMRITECIVRLSPNKPLVPQLNIVAEYRIREYQIFVTIAGVPGDMSIEFSSAPSLPKEDILAMLITGATRSELSQSGGGQQAQDFGSALILQQILNAIGIGSFVSAQVSGTSASVIVSPESWNGLGIQAVTEQKGDSALNFLYRIKFE